MEVKAVKPKEKFRISGDWPGTKSKITKELVGVIFEIVESFFGKKLPCTVLITNFPTANNPIAYYAMKDGCYQVNLSVKFGTSWCQIAYQLAHELCHLNSNYAASIGHKYKWFEESLCEMCSVAVLTALSKQWNKVAVYKYNKNYAAEIKKYVDSLNSVTGFMPGDKSTYNAWLTANTEELEKNSTNRELNGVTANYLYRNLFRDHPESWICVGMLNQWNCHENSSFAEFKKSWRKSCRDSFEINRILNIL
ncbi:hypothetical protein [Pseudomonas viridiflava]|uniref:hypothetical protein n=1 Tax=Pseudomonas viridiflava TaxID=33069 RepID=UPI002ECB21BD|nr:hypothetical protein [Pseudomonas viridiflava]